MKEQTSASASTTIDDSDTCGHCGSATLIWRKCKQLCTCCGQINRSCADL